MLIEIFKRLSKGSNILLFINLETFKGLGVAQANYYDCLVKIILFNGYTKENLNKCIDLLISKVKKLQEEYKDALKNKSYHEEFNIKTSINDYVICILKLYLKMVEEDKVIKYFHDNYIESIKEIKEYMLLDRIKSLNLKNVWLKEYESKVGKIKFRDSIVEDYKKFKLIIDKK